MNSCSSRPIDPSVLRLALGAIFYTAKQPAVPIINHHKKSGEPKNVNFSLDIEFLLTLFYKVLHILRSSAMENSKIAEDLKFMRSMIERTQRQIDPGAPSIIVWGIVCIIGYCGTQWLLVHAKHGYDFNILWGILYLFGFSLSWFFDHRLKKRMIAKGIKSYISKQINWVWAILVINGIVWGCLIFFNNMHLAHGTLDGKAFVEVYLRSLRSVMFLWAGIYGIALTMMGILYSKEWLIAGIAVFVSIVIATFVRPYSYIILGIVMGLGCIIPGLIAIRRQRKWEAESAGD